MNLDKYKSNYKDEKENLLSLTDCEWFWVVGEDRILCNLCPNNYKCLRLRSRITKNDNKHFSSKERFKVKYNCSVRYEPNGEVEFVKYNHTWENEIKDELLGNNLVIADKTKLLAPNENGTYEIIKDNFTFYNLYRSINNSRKRSLQNFYSYVLANQWQYWLTLTFSPEHVNRYDDAEVIEKWSIFQKWFKKKNPDAKIIVVPEYHEKVNEDGKRALHFHGFMADCPNIRLEPAKWPNGDYMYSTVDKSPSLHILDWEYGFSTVAVIPLENNNLKIANYMSEYMTKAGERVGYGKKMYYHTRNLNMCQSVNYLFPDNDFAEIVEKYNLEQVKESKGITVYRGRLDKN